MRLRVWLKHNKKEEWERCPLCNMPLRWSYDGLEWIPCDKEPILYKFDLIGEFKIIKKRELIDNCIIYKGGNTTGYSYGLIPHIYTCYDLDGWKGAKFVR